MLEVDGVHVGEVVSIPESKILDRQWMGVQFARADVARAAMRLLDDGEVWVPGAGTAKNIPLCSLEKIGEIGPDRRDILDGFEYTDTVSAYPMIHGHDTEQRNRLTAESDKYLLPLSRPRPGRRLKRLEQLWPKAAQLLIAERIWLNTTRVVSMFSDRPVLSNVWWEVKTDSQAFDKAIALFLNSSVGILARLATRNTTRGGWVALKKVELEDMPVLDVRAISDEQLQALADLFDELADEEFERLPAMAECAARRRLDDGLSAILGLPDLAGLRQLLATEPVVANARL